MPDLRRQSVPDRNMPARRVVHACCTCSACGREVTVDDAPAGMLPHLRSRLRAEVGPRAVAAGRAFDEFVDAVCRCWNAEHWTKLARAQPESEMAAVKDAKVLIAKVREDVEAMWGDSPELQKLYGDVGTDAVESFARLWFESMANRTWMRQACREARKT
jgi:hypothetical protein